MMLCGSMFGLHVIRHRLFESNTRLLSKGTCLHTGTVSEGSYVTVAGHGGDGIAILDVWRDAMQIPWADKDELTQAIPPAYTRWIGRQVIQWV